MLKTWFIGRLLVFLQRKYSQKHFGWCYECRNSPGSPGIFENPEIPSKPELQEGTPLWNRYKNLEIIDFFINLYKFARARGLSVTVVIVLKIYCLLCRSQISPGIKKSHLENRAMTLNRWKTKNTFAK